MTQELHDDLLSFFQSYQRAFDALDGIKIASHYHEPTMTVRGDGSVHVVHRQLELQEFFCNVVTAYAAEGYRSSILSDLSSAAVGSRAALASMRWTLLDEQGNRIRSWQQTYNLIRKGEEWRILVSTFHH